MVETRRGEMTGERDNQLIKLDEDKRLKFSTDINIKDDMFSEIMSLYTLAMNEVEEKIQCLNESFREKYQYDLVDHTMKRLKSPKSIMNKMKQKQYQLTYQELIENINDIAGVRVICPLKKDVYSVRTIIANLPDLKILKEKDYIENPKKSGYSCYHMIVEVPINFEGTIIFVKVEVQIRTMAMDFWSTLEHKIKYKNKREISKKDSRRLVLYAKIINHLDDKMLEIYS